MSPWPELSAERDRPTIVALHLFSQVVGKVPTALLPWRNHGWHLTLHVTPRGLRTEPIHAPGGAFALAFDLADHELIYESATARMSVPLQPMPVADFHHVVMEMMARAGTASTGCTERSSRPTASSACFARLSSARSARSISSGAASISPSPDSRVDRHRCTRAAFPTCPTR
jgi:hypothetical protein